MGQYSKVEGLFKKNYGGISDPTLKGQKFFGRVKFEEKKKVGQTYTECVIMGAETGSTWGGDKADVVDINAAVAGSVVQADVTDFFYILNSNIPLQTISRAAEEGDQAFKSATKHVVANNIKSHLRIREIEAIYGQSQERLGYVSYETTTYRGATITAGAGTIPSTVFGSVTVSAGVDTTNRFIFLGREFAAGIWAGMEGCPIVQIDNSSGLAVAGGKLLAVDADYGLLLVDFTPVAATSATSHSMGFAGWEYKREMIGVISQLQNTGTQHGINATQYPYWRGTTMTAGGNKFTQQRVNQLIALAVNRAGLSEDITGYINPRMWNNIHDTLLSQRQFDESYNKKELENGAETIKFYGQNGSTELVPFNVMKENKSLFLKMDSWSRFGSSNVTFKVPNSDKELIFPAENQTAMIFRSYSSMTVFCNERAKNMLMTNINDEAAS